MKHLAIVVCTLAASAGLFWQFPLFRVVRSEGAATAGDRESFFNATDFADAFWNDRLMPAINKAADATTVLSALRDNPKTAREQFGRKVGVSRTRFFIVRGNGKIVSIDKKGLGVSLDQTRGLSPFAESRGLSPFAESAEQKGAVPLSGKDSESRGLSPFAQSAEQKGTVPFPASGAETASSDNPDIVLHTGLLFGNAVRDATGLLNAGDFPHSQDFNEISSTLNRITEERVITSLKRRAAIGRRVDFAGCAQIADDSRDPRPLVVIPLKATVE